VFDNVKAFTLSGAGTRVVNASVINTGTVKVTNTTVQFTGTFTNNGAYVSDPADNFFTDLTVGASGYIQAGAGDRFFIAGSYASSSTKNTLFNVDGAELHFIGGGPHTYNVTGTASDFTTVAIDAGNSLTVAPGSRALPANTVNSGALAFPLGNYSAQAMIGSGSIAIGGGSRGGAVDGQCARPIERVGGQERQAGLCPGSTARHRHAEHAGDQYRRRGRSYYGRVAVELRCQRQPARRHEAMGGLGARRGWRVEWHRHHQRAGGE